MSFLGYTFVSLQTQGVPQAMGLFFKSVIATLCFSHPRKHCALYRRCQFFVCTWLLVCSTYSLASVEDWSHTRLSEFGFPPQEYALLFEWNERVTDGSLVHGARIAPLDTLIPFDCYLSDAGELLGGDALKALGIKPKNWDMPPIRQAPQWKPGVPVKYAPPTPAPRSVGMSIPELVLPPVDMAQILDEDMAQKSPIRIGVFQEIPSGVLVQGKMADYSDWRTLSDGTRLWAISLRSPEAKGIRVHFEMLRLPEGGSVIVYSDDDPGEVYGPFASEDGLWTPTCFAEAVTIEVVLAPGAKVETAHIEIDRIVHQYLDLPLKAAGACNLDVTCYPDWAGVALGVGGIGTIGTTGSLWCTGSLLADNARGTHIPYFLTANHCVGGPYTAGTIEVYWLYQTSVCNGAAPSPVNVPRTTGGADYLAGATNTAGNDFTLLRLRNDPPSGLVFLGFSTESVALGTETVCIHHPQGDFKRISFGTTTDSGSPSNNYVPLKPLDRYHESLWHAGTTEGGSSGSPLLLADAKTIIGQLYGGRASCVRPEEPDYYGRFDLTFPVVEEWLGPSLSPYDLDQSGTVNTLDVQLALDAALHRQDIPQADLSGSGRVDASDIQLIIAAALTEDRR